MRQPPCPIRFKIYAYFEKKMLTIRRFFLIIIELTGCGEVWYRAWFGTEEASGSNPDTPTKSG